MKAKVTLLSIFMLLCFYGGAATISTNKASYAPGEAIVVTFGEATALTDWVGMYNSSITPGPQNSLAWLYLNGSQTTPAEVIPNGTLTFTAPGAAGSYKMCFHPNDGYTVTATANFTVSTSGVAPVAAFSSSSFFVAPGSTVSFKDQSLHSPTSWSWSFPGGTPSTSTEQNPEVKYDTAGTYAVSLTATNAAGSNELTRAGYVTVAAVPDTATEVKFMHLNIWVDATVVTNGLTYIRDIVAEVNPDIVCFVEVTNQSGDWTTKLVNELASIGHYYHRGYVNGSDASIISKFPINSAGPLLRSTVSIFDVDVHGKSIVVAAAHLDYTYYACYLPRGYRCGGSPPYNGWSQIGSPDPQPVTDLSIINQQNLGSQRDEQIGAFLDYVATETRPIVLMGDFNEPSHEDWTENQANLFDHHGVVFEWTTTKSLTDHDFTDAYRKVYPDEVLNPGITWPAYATGKGNTSWTPKSDDRDRIDFIFYKGEGMVATDAAVVGPKEAYAKSVLTTENNGNDKFLADTLPWPSDHKGVYASLLVPAAGDTATANRVPVNAPAELKVFPNPGSGIYRLVSTEDGQARVKVTDMEGKEIWTKELQLIAYTAETCDLSGLSAGIYLLNVVTSKGSYSRKIVKK